MANRRPDGHKRSNSSMGLSIFNRDRDKDEENAGFTGPSIDPPSDSPTSLHHGLSALRPHRSRVHDQIADGSEDPMVTMQKSKSGFAPQTVSGSTAGSQEMGTTIEQSVKMFRLFEVLRGGDEAAINRAVIENARKSSKERILATKLQGTTIMHLAIQCADPPVLAQVLSIADKDPEVEVDINAQDRDGNTPLHLASMLGRASITSILLAQKNIDPYVLNYQNCSPLDIARTPEIFQQLQFARAQFTEKMVYSVHTLVKSDDYVGLEKLLEDPRVEAVLDVNAEELVTDISTIESGGTLLHEGAWKRDMKLIQLLLLHGADPFRRDRRGKLPQDVTKDDRIRAILKKSPAAAAAQRRIQEKAILGSSSAEKSSLGSRESREMKGYLKKWTNYTSGYKLRWFVLEDGVLSYYKHQDDAGSACRGAMNMRIAKLSMDAQDKTRFEIHGKSSIKYHLKANHIVEAKRWFWALNNAIQWTKDEARETEQGKKREELVRQSGPEQKGRAEGDEHSKHSGKGLVPATTLGVPLNTGSRVSSRTTAIGTGGSIAGDDHQESLYESYDPSATGAETGHEVSATKELTMAGDVDYDEEYEDDASSHEQRPAPKDAFNIIAHSANLQLELLAQVSAAVQTQTIQQPETRISDPTVVQAISTYESAIRSLRSMVGNLLSISHDRDAYWQSRLDREANMRRLWEDSMTKVAREQEELEGRIGQSEIKRKRAKKALRDALDGTPSVQTLMETQVFPRYVDQVSQAPSNLDPGAQSDLINGRRSIGVRGRRKSTIAALADLSDSDSEADQEFFDAVGAGEVEVLNIMPSASKDISAPMEVARDDGVEVKKQHSKVIDLGSSFNGYEEAVRKRLTMDADDRPKISLWSILKSMIGKDMTKMTLPVSFNEPTSLLQRVAEDMEYTDLLDTASRRDDSTERMVYVAAFAASEYASTIGRVAKPFNPLLGETYEYARPDKGYRFFIEQVSHHPPIGAAWAESPRWDYYGESAVKSKFYGKSFDINPLGTWFLKLRPSIGGEELYTWKKVTSSVIGIITGSPTVDNYGLMEVKNWMTGETCILDFKPRGWKASSAHQVNGKVAAADGTTRWSIGGRWNDKIYARPTPGFDGTIDLPEQSRVESGLSQAFLVWEAHSRPTGIPFNLTPFVVTLNALSEGLKPFLPPTDTRLRPDQRAMEDGQYDLAAAEKNRVEEKQRATRRRREANGEEFVPRWFKKGKCTITGEEYWVTNGEYWKMREGVSRGRRWENVEDIF